MKSDKEMAEKFIEEYKKSLELEKAQEEIHEAANRAADEDESNEALQNEAVAAYTAYVDLHAQTNVNARFALDYAIKANLI